MVLDTAAAEAWRPKLEPSLPHIHQWEASGLWEASVSMYGCELDHKESWAPKNWCFWTVVLEKTLKSLSDCKEIKQINPKGNQSWIFTGRTDAEPEAPILWPPDEKNSLKKNMMLGKIEGRRRRGWQWMRWLDGITDAVEMTWANFGRWWRTGRPGVLQSIGSQRVEHDWATK